MAKIAITAVLLWGLLPGASKAADTIGAIDFFGYAGLDVPKIRAALPVHVGDALTDAAKPQIEESVAHVIGKKPTDVAEVCCDEKGQWLMYIGLPGGSYKPFDLNQAPTGRARLPAEIVKLEGRTSDALFAAVEKGTAEEDDSPGYALAKDLALRSLQLKERTWALAHGPELLLVLRSSSNSRQREIASEVLGYWRQCAEQVAALEYATRDEDSIVRNNAIRALMVLVSAKPELGQDLNADLLLEMLGSGAWTDHNKVAGLLEPMTRSRDPKLLAKIRSQALEPLIEMASWSEQGHAMAARVVLGRVGGIPEAKLGALAWDGPLATILDSVRKIHPERTLPESNDAQPAEEELR